MLVPTSPQVDPDALINEVNRLYAYELDIARSDIDDLSEEQQKHIKGMIGESVQWEQFPRGFFCKLYSDKGDRYLRQVKQQLLDHEHAMIDYPRSWFGVSCPLMHVRVPVGVYDLRRETHQRMGTVGMMIIDPFLQGDCCVIKTVPLDLVEARLEKLRNRP